LEDIVDTRVARGHVGEQGLYLFGAHGVSVG
jgi:hypothetical protein